MSLTHSVKSLGLLYMVYDLFNSSSQISSTHTHIKFSNFVCLFPFPFPLFPSAAKQIPLKGKEKKRKEKKRKIFPFYPIFSQQPNTSVPTNKIKKKFQNFILTLFPLLFSATKPIPKKRSLLPVFSQQPNKSIPTKIRKKKSHTFPVDCPYPL